MNGNVSLTVPFGQKGFDGYVTGTMTGFYPILMMGSIPYIPADGTTAFTMAPKASLDSLLMQADGITLDPTKGHILLFASNCAFQASAGVSAKVMGVDPSHVVYATNATPDPKATQTDASGGIVAINLAPGQYTVETDLAANGKTIAKATAIVVAGTITEIYMLPTP